MEGTRERSYLSEGGVRRGVLLARSGKTIVVNLSVFCLDLAAPWVTQRHSSIS